MLVELKAMKNITESKGNTLILDLLSASVSLLCRRFRSLSKEFNEKKRVQNYLLGL